MTRALFAVEVEGDSMQPTFGSGDWLLCRRVRKIQVGQVVVVQRDGVGLVVKRVMEVGSEGAVWLEGDNPEPASSTDSRQWGWVRERDVLGRVWLRYRRGRC